MFTKLFSLTFILCTLPCNLSKCFSSVLVLNEEFRLELELPSVPVPGSPGVLVFQISEVCEVPHAISLNLIWELDMLLRNQFYFNFWLFSGEEFYVGRFFLEIFVCCFNS